MVRPGSSVSSDTAMSDDMAVEIKYSFNNMYYVYYLKMNSSQIYTGSTKDLKTRIRLHESGNVNTTSKYLPVTLIGYESYILKSDAQRREKYLKTTEGKRLFRQQFRDILKQIARPGSSVDRAEDF